MKKMTEQEQQTILGGSNIGDPATDDPPGPDVPPPN